MTQRPPTAASPEALRIQERFERLLAASLAISAEHAIDAVLQRVVESAREVVGARYAALGVLNEDGKTLASFLTSGISEEQRALIGPPPTGHGLVGVLVSEAKPMRIAKISQDPRSHGFPEHHPPMESFLGVPILGKGRVYGDLYFTEKVDAAEFTDEDERIAVLLAAQAAAAIESAHLIERQDALLGRLQAMQNQRDQFFAMINHELRNALTGVYGWSEQLVRAKSEATMQRAGREIYEAAERTITLLNNLLELSRIDAGKTQPVHRDSNLGDIVGRVLAQMQPAADAKSIVLKRDVPDAALGIRTDPLRLEQILLNLLSNAVRHSPRHQPIEVRVRRVANEVLIDVTDHGNGIAPADQQRIFEPYVRVDPESGLGSGLGLPVSRRLAELLGGRLTVSSDVGKGATFTIALPAGAAS